MAGGSRDYVISHSSSVAKHSREQLGTFSDISRLHDELPVGMASHRKENHTCEKKKAELIRDNKLSPGARGDAQDTDGSAPCGITSP